MVLRTSLEFFPGIIFILCNPHVQGTLAIDLNMPYSLSEGLPSVGRVLRLGPHVYLKCRLVDRWLSGPGATDGASDLVGKGSGERGMCSSSFHKLLLGQSPKLRRVQKP